MSEQSRLNVLELGDTVRTAYCGHFFVEWGANVVKPSQRISLPESARLFLDRGKSAESQIADDTVGWDVILAPDSSTVTDWCSSEPEVAATVDGGPVIGVASMFGDGGEYAELHGSEVQALALSGLMNMVGEPGREPLRLGGYQGENAAAASLFTGVWLALFQRQESGHGSVVRTSVVRSAAYLDWKSQIHFAEEGTILRRGNTNGPLVLRCQDGHVGFYFRDEEWDAVKGLVGDERLHDPRFATQLGRDRHRDELVEIIDRYSRGVTKNELYHAAQAVKIPAGAVLTLSELPDDPQLAARSALRYGITENGRRYTSPRAPWTVDGRREETR